MSTQRRERRESWGWRGGGESKSERRERRKRREGPGENVREIVGRGGGREHEQCVCGGGGVRETGEKSSKRDYHRQHKSFFCSF